MPVSGKKREIKSFEKSVGLFEANVVSINPSREELEKLLGGVELEKDPEYLKEDDKDGKQKLSVSVWLEEVLSKQLFNVRFFLKDEFRVNKDGTKNQYINSIGSASWSDDPENLPSWMLEGGREIRQAHIGEEEMYKFFRSWLSSLDTRDADAKLELDWKKLMRGNVKEIQDFIGSGYEGTIVALATVRTSDDGENDYQQVYNREFLPGYTFKYFKLGGKKMPKFVQKFIENVEDPEYGCKEFYGTTLGVLHAYVPEENIATSDASGLTDNGPDL